MNTESKKSKWIMKPSPDINYKISIVDENENLICMIGNNNNFLNAELICLFPKSVKLLKAISSGTLKEFQSAMKEVPHLINRIDQIKKFIKD